MSDQPKIGDRVRFTIQGTLQPWTCDPSGDTVMLIDEETKMNLTFALSKQRPQDFEIIEPEWKVGMLVVHAADEYVMIHRIIALHGKYAWVQANSERPVSIDTLYLRRYIQ